ncbi:hypothetical protein B0H14DRAFT_2567686 [Mycena olivaceomarginata]|nr:hypothetical protein B0H14DRAFT_2567686 [Mycena olivaceomarginata]
MIGQLDLDRRRAVRALRWLGEVPMGYRSAIRVLPRAQEVKGTLGPHTRRWSCTVLEPGLVFPMVQDGVVGMLPNDQEDKENTGAADTCRLAGGHLLLRIGLGWQEHRVEVGRTGRTGYSQCPMVQKGDVGMLPNDGMVGMGMVEACTMASRVYHKEAVAACVPTEFCTLGAAFAPEGDLETVQTPASRFHTAPDGLTSSATRVFRLSSPTTSGSGPLNETAMASACSGLFGLPITQTSSRYFTGGEGGYIILVGRTVKTRWVINSNSSLLTIIPRRSGDQLIVSPQQSLQKWQAKWVSPNLNDRAASAGVDRPAHRRTLPSYGYFGKMVDRSQELDPASLAKSFDSVTQDSAMELGDWVAGWGSAMWDMATMV